jgi:tRNA A37 N6-isopentenylltransferase MiaA
VENKTEAMAAIPHQGINLCDAGKAFDVRQYIACARSIANQMPKYKNLHVVGGAGFYLKSFL